MTSVGKSKLLILAAAMTLMVSINAAFAVPVPLGTFTFSGTSPGDGRDQNAKASFTANGTTLIIDLWNTGGANQVGGISSVLDGIAFSFVSSITSITPTTGSAPDGMVNCTGVSCVFDNTPASETNSTPFGWKDQHSGGSPFTTEVFAPQGFKPKGIVNANLTHTDGIPNAQHNPYLVSDSNGTTNPVEFQLTVGGVNTVPALDIHSVKFYFGTGPDVQPGTCIRDCEPTTQVVPEPSTWLMLVTGTLCLLGYGWSRGRAPQEADTSL
jgi:hypothetical protein